MTKLDELELELQDAEAAYRAASAATVRAYDVCRAAHRRIVAAKDKLLAYERTPKDDA